MRIRTLQKWFSLVCLGTLFLLSAMAFMQQATGSAEKNFSVTKEKRKAAPPPCFQGQPSRQWGKAFEAYFDDRFPCRKTWIKNYRSIFVKTLLSPYADRLPGRDRYEFYRGEIPELETYMGICELTDEETEDWLTILEGRKAWSDAMGIQYLQVIVPYRAFLEEEHLPARLRRQRRQSIGQRIHEATRGKSAADVVLYPVELLRRSERTRGESCYYEHDSHLSPYGIFLLYELINEKIREVHPEVRAISLTRSAKRDRGPSCRIDGKWLSVDCPGEENILDDYYMTQRDTGNPYPEKNVMTRRTGPGLRLLFSNDSMARLTLDSWEKPEGHVHLPFGAGIQQVRSFMWRTLDQGFLEWVVTSDLPDIWVEEMLEDRLKRLHFEPDPALRAARAFGESSPLKGIAVPDAPGDSLHLLAVLEEPTSATTPSDPHAMAPIRVRFLLGDECVHETTTYQGIRRAVFTPPIPIHPRHIGQKARVEIDGQAKSTRLSLRVSE